MLNRCVMNEIWSTLPGIFNPAGVTIDLLYKTIQTFL